MEGRALRGRARLGGRPGPHRAGGQRPGRLTEGEIASNAGRPMPIGRRMASPLFVGRAGELERLEQALQRAVHERSGAVLVTGEAGVGKTRLVAEFGGRIQPTSRVLLVATVRTDGLGRDHLVAVFVAELGRHERVERIDLAGLGPLETARQVAAIQGSMPEPSVLDRIVTQSDGNPFVVEELLAGGLVDGDVPPTLRQIVLFRVAERSELAQDVLRALAVGGHGVDHELIATVVGRDEADLTRALRELVDHDLVVVDRDDDDYRFRHVLVRDAVYADVLPGERRRLHRRYADELTRL